MNEESVSKEYRAFLEFLYSTAAGDRSKALHLLGFCLKFTFLNTSLPLILLHQFFIHKGIHALKDKIPHKPFFQNFVN